MRKIIIAIGFLTVLLIMPASVLSQPVLTVDEPEHEFEPVVEGNLVSHTFVFKNTGETNLNILKVQPP